MEKKPNPAIPSVLILKADKLYADALHKSALAVLPHANIRIAATVAGASLALTAAPVDLLITGIGLSVGGDVFELFANTLGTDAYIRRTLVVTTNRECQQLAALRRLAIPGAFDSATEDLARFKIALRTVMDGRTYWSRSLLELVRHYALQPNSPPHLLTAGEQLVLSVVGDGSDDIEAATKLGLSPATISTVRRNLHRKLGVQHRGELIRLAAQSGYVRFTPAGIVRPGFTLLAAACRDRTRKPTNHFAA